MHTPQTQTLFKKMNARRRELGMSCAALAQRSGVSMPTVVRILSGNRAQARFENVLAIAEALGMTMRIEATTNVEELREAQAEEKAAQLIALVQGTSGLEGQGLDADTLAQMKRRTVHELLAGSKRTLWGD